MGGSHATKELAPIRDSHGPNSKLILRKILDPFRLETRHVRSGTQGAGVAFRANDG